LVATVDRHLIVCKIPAWCFRPLINSGFKQ
jgi:hypothetical protein